MPRILLLGGTGAMGKPLTDELAKKNYDIYITTRQKKEDRCNVHYLQGNGHDMEFIRSTISLIVPDVIVDFMVYNSREFEERAGYFLNNTGLYIFLSSARVYSDSGLSKLNEHSNRILDVCTDKEYFATDEYALTKARQENILFSQESKDNFIIFRPYITYFTERLQLGIIEKEQWLYRALAGRSIVFSKDIANKYTTLTWGGDVAKTIANCIFLEGRCNKIINPVSNETITWGDLLELYVYNIEKYTGVRPKVFYTESCERTTEILNNKYQYIYDRSYNRCFDNDCAKKILGRQFKTIEDGIDESIQKFIKEKREFLPIHWDLEGYYDYLTHESIPIHRFPGIKKMARYELMKRFGIKIV